MKKKQILPNENELIRCFDITPDNVLYSIYKDSAIYFISMTYYNKMREFKEEKDPKKKIQAWNYVKSLVRLLRERNMWDYKEQKPSAINDSKKSRGTKIKCCHCALEFHTTELLYDRYGKRGKCPVCGLLLIKDRKKKK